MARRVLRRKTPAELLVAAFCNRYPGSIEELAEMLPKERVEYVVGFCINVLRSAPIEVMDRCNPGALK